MKVKNRAVANLTMSKEVINISLQNVFCFFEQRPRTRNNDLVEVVSDKNLMVSKADRCVPGTMRHSHRSLAHSLISLRTAFVP